MGLFSLALGLLWPWLFFQPSEYFCTRCLQGITREQSLLLLEHGPAVVNLAVRLMMPYFLTALVVAYGAGSTLDLWVLPPLRRRWRRVVRERRRARRRTRLAEGSGL